MRASSRRQFIQSSVIGVAAAALPTSAQSAANTGVSKTTIDQVRSSQAKELQASTAHWNERVVLDCLAKR